MNLLHGQAEDFVNYHFNENENHKVFLQDLRNELKEYHKLSHKLEFLNKLSTIIKIGYDNHFKECNSKENPLECGTNKNNENILFFVQNEKDELNSQLSPLEFTLEERSTLNENLEKILRDLNTIKIGQEFTYDDLSKEFEDLKEYYFLNKKNWSQLFIGKISEMVAGGVINETVSQEIVSAVIKNYPGLIR